MNKIHQILENLKEGIPQALSRFNDGEVQGIVQPGCTVARGDQQVNEDLSNKLKEALQHQQENYWVGIPCNKCNTAKWYKRVINLVDPNYKYLTKAVVTTNRNWKLFTSSVKECVKDKHIIWVSGANQKLENLPFDVDFHLKVPKRNAWRAYEEANKAFELFPSGTVIFFSCGPMSRVLAYEWFKKRPDSNYLDIGSAFDPYTKNLWHACHKETLAPCEGCN